jgi:hypothetical protein
MIEHLINQTKLIMYAVSELQRSDEYGWDSDVGEQKNYSEHRQLELAQRELDGAITYLQEAQRMQKGCTE